MSGRKDTAQDTDLRIELYERMKKYRLNSNFANEKGGSSFRINEMDEPPCQKTVISQSLIDPTVNESNK